MSLYSVDSSTGDIDLLAGSTKYADNPIGTILPYGGTTAPSGWFLCQGQAISRTDYSDLFAVIGTAFGSGNGSTTFNIPDLRGEFLRGAGTNSHTNQGNGGTVGQHQDASNILRMNTWGTDLYSYIDSRGDSGVYGNNFDSELTNPGYIRQSAAGNILKDFTSTPTVGGTVTTRPTNTSVNYIIKAKHIPVPADFKDAIDEAVEEALNGIGTVYTRQISVQAIEGGDWHVLDSVSVSGLPNGNYLVCLKGTPNVISQNFTSIVQIDGRGIGHSMAGGSYPYLSDSIIYTKNNDNAIGVSVYIPTNSSLEAGTIYFDFVRLS